MGDNSTFDQKFRNKMQQLDTDFQEAAWERFAPQITPQTKPTFFAKIGNKWAYLAAAAGLGLIFYFYPKQNPNPSVQVIAKQEASQISIEPVEKGASIIATPKKQEQVVSTNNSHNNPNNPSISIKHTVKKEETIVANRYNSLEIQKPQINSTEEIVRILPEKNSIEVPVTETVVEKTATTPTEISSHNNKTLTRIDSLVQEISHLAIEQRAIQNEYMPLPDIPLVSKKFQLYTSVQGQYAGKKSGGGVGILLTYRKKWGLNVGLNYAQEAIQSFQDEEEFNKNNDQDFRSIVSTPTNAVISGIQTQDKEWELPISLQYQQPIWKNLSGIAQVGANLVLQKKEHLSYRFEPQGMPMQQGNFHHAPRPHNFSERRNSFVSLGLQGEWQKWQVQVLGVLNEKEKPPKMRKEELPISMGLQARVNYRISSF